MLVVITGRTGKNVDLLQQKGKTENYLEGKLCMQFRLLMTRFYFLSMDYMCTLYTFRLRANKLFGLTNRSSKTTAKRAVESGKKKRPKLLDMKLCLNLLHYISDDLIS